MAMDPSSRQLTDLQWEQAFSAYNASRQRVKSSGGSGHRSSQRSSSRRHSRSEQPIVTSASSSLTKAGALRRHVRDASGYQDLRLLVNLVAYVLVGLVIINTGVQIFFYTDLLASLSVLIRGVLLALSLIVLRSIVHVLIDIPDIMLYREINRNNLDDGEEVANESEHITE